MAPLLAAADLAFGHPGHPTVGQGVALELAAGEVLCLLGPNGTGKTTLLKTLLGLLPPHGGRVLAAGEDLAGWPAARRARHLGYVPQSATPTFPFPVEDIVLMGRAARSPLFASPGAADRAAAAAALERVGIAALALRPFSALSGGERQMVLVARALAQEPAVLVLDEPTASLDFANQDRVLELIAGLAAEGIAVIFTTHHPDQAFAVASHVAMLRDGGILAAGETRAVLTGPALTQLYGREVLVREVEGRTVCFTGAAIPAAPRPPA